jgi:plasmid replication initiation protein
VLEKVLAEAKKGKSVDDELLKEAAAIIKSGKQPESLSFGLVKLVGQMLNTPEQEDGVEDEKKPLDFFVANFTDCAIKDDQATMEAPMFSLSTKRDMTQWKWTSADGKKTVVVEPSITGRATIHDKDILIFCISQIVAAINEGKKPSRLVRFTAYNFFKATNRGTSKDDYNRFKAALKRLRGTQITTNIETGKTREARGFGFIDGWGVIEKSDKDSSMIAVEVELSLWIYRAIAAKEVLTISPDYFTLRKPLERRLYEIARKHVGKQASWEIGIEALRNKCGSKAAIRNWRIDLKEIIQADTLPDYLIELQEKTVLFKPRPNPI